MTTTLTHTHTHTHTQAESDRIVRMTVLIEEYKCSHMAETRCRAPGAESLSGLDPSDHSSVETRSPPTLHKDPGCF